MSLRDREKEVQCRLTLLGEEGVGKSALVNKFSKDEFLQSSGRKENGGHIVKSVTTLNRKVRFVLSECSNLEDLLPSSPHLTADVFLLCFSISDQPSLHSVLEHWLPVVKTLCSTIPAVLVGCKADLRISGRIQRLVSAEQALSFSRQADTLMYVETSAISGDTRSITAPFEVAALAALGQFSRHSFLVSERSRQSRSSRCRDMSEPRVTSSRTRLNCLGSPGESYQKLRLSGELCGSVGSVSVHSKSSTLSSTGSDRSTVSGDSVSGSPVLNLSANLCSPVLCVTTGRTPGMVRRVGKKNQTGKTAEMVTIKCQRLREDRTYEEIDIQVPADVYNNIQTPGDLSQCSRNSQERKSFGSKLRSLLTKS